MTAHLEEGQKSVAGRASRIKPLLYKKDTAAWPRFAKLHLNKPHDFWNNVSWTDETKVELFSLNTQGHTWKKTNIAFQQKQVSMEMEGWWFQVVLLPQYLGTLKSLHTVYQSITGDKWEIVCLTAKSWPKLVGKWSTLTNIYGWKITYSQSRPQLNRNAVMGL